MPMTYLSEVLSEEWQKADPAQFKEFSYCKIGRHESLADGVFRYAVADDGNHRSIVLLEGATKGDPLKGVANCDLILKDGKIVGINIEGDCVILKTTV